MLHQGFRLFERISISQILLKAPSHYALPLSVTRLGALLVHRGVLSDHLPQHLTPSYRLRFRISGLIDLHAFDDQAQAVEAEAGGFDGGADLEDLFFG